MSQLTIQEAQKKHQNKLMSIPGVIGIGIGAADGAPVINVLVVKITPKLENEIPKSLEGYRVIVLETGEIRALNKN